LLHQAFLLLGFQSCYLQPLSLLLCFCSILGQQFCFFFRNLSFLCQQLCRFLGSELREKLFVVTLSSIYNFTLAVSQEEDIFPEQIKG